MVSAFFILPAAVILIITRCDAPLIVRFAYQQTSNQGLPCLPVAKTLRGTSRPGRPTPHLNLNFL